MAKQKPKRSLTERLLLGDPAALKQVRGDKKKPAKREVGLAPSYNLVFDPTGQQSELLRGEADAVRDLYLRRVGESIDDAPDKRAALESAGLIHGGARGGRTPTDAAELYASATDAMDAISRVAKSPVGGFLGEQLFGDYRRNPSLLAYNPMAQTRAAIDFLRESPLGAGPAISAVGAVAPIVAPIVGKAPLPSPAAQAASLAAGEGYLSLEESAKIAAKGLRKGAQVGKEVGAKVPVPVPAAQVASIAAGKGYLSWGDIGGTIERAAQKPNDFIDVTRKKPIIVPGAGKGTPGGDLISLGKAGQSASTLQTSAGSSNPFSPNAMIVMRNLATENGWDTSDWEKLQLGEQIYRAVNEKDNTRLFFRSLLRGVGEMAAVPASIPAIVEASADALEGDTESAKTLFRGVVEPYVQANETYQKRGFWPAAGEFIRDNPVDAITAFMSAAKGVSRVAGAAARANLLGERLAGFAERGRAIEVPGRPIEVEPRMPTPIPLPEPVVPTSVGKQAVRATIAENRRRAAARADIEAQNAEAEALAREQIRAFEEEGTMVPSATPPLVIGSAGKGLAGTAFTQFVHAPIVKAFPAYRRMLERRVGNRPMRIAYNEAQGAGLEIEAAFTRALGEGSSVEVKNRAAFNLFMPAVDAAGKAITPRYVADFFRAELSDLREKIDAQRGRARQDDLQRQTWLEGQIETLDKLDDVVVPEDAMARLRAEVKPVGALNDAVIAAGAGVPLEVAKRWNLIRVVAMDKRVSGGLEEAAQALYRERNAAYPELVRIQERLKRRAFAVQQYAKLTGWGKYGPKSSKKAFRKAADAMFADLRRGAELARQNGNAELRSMFETAMTDLSRGRLDASGIDRMGTQLVADIQAMRLSPEQVKALPTESRMQYEAAQRLAEQESAAAAEAAGALRSVGLRRVTKGTVAYAENRLKDAQDELAAYEAFPNPDPKVVARRRAKVAKAEADRDARLKALMASEQKIKLAQQKQVRLDRAVMESGTGVMDTPEFRAVLDVSERFAVMEVKGRKDLFYRIDRLREEVLDDYVKRLESQDQMPAAHMMQTPDFENIGKTGRYEGQRSLNRSQRGFIRAGRFQESDGYLFVSGQETAKYWDTLLRNTQEVTTAAVLTDSLDLLVQATSTPFRFTDNALARAKRMVEDDAELLQNAGGDADKALRNALALIMKEATPVGRADVNMGEVVVLNIDSPSARTVSSRVSYGPTKDALGDEEALGRFAMRTLDERSLNPNEPGVYYIMPRSVYDGIQNAIRNETYRIRKEESPILYRADRITRLWRAITLNVLPRTAINNTIGSMILAVQAGAGPRAMYYAWMAINGKPVKLRSGERVLLPVPRELRQRYYEQLTDPISQAEGALKPVAAWMNQMRFFNGMSEDLGRLAVWYHKAYPEAMKSADGVRFFKSAQGLTSKSVEMLDAMARRDPVYRTLMDEYVQMSFDFLGDLHRGGPIASRIRIFVPFWQWYAHMLKLTFFTMPFRYPKRALFLQMLGEVGRDYQERVGVSVPWGESFVPFFTEVIDTPTGAQQVVAGTDLGNWWPEATVSVLGGSEGEFGGVGFLQGAVAPVWTNSALIVASLMSVSKSSAIEVDDRNFVVAAKDEFGLPIDSYDSAFASYVANKLFRMFPLSPTIMSASGRASNAFPIPGLMEPKKYATEQLPEELRQKQRSDVASVVDDWKANLPGFLSKAILGLPIQYMPGAGSIAAQRYLREYEYEIRKLEDEQDAILETLMGRHDYPTNEGKNR